MRTIWKYRLEVTHKQDIELPVDSKALCVQMQNGHPCLWVLVAPKSPPGIKTIHIYGTGHDLPIDPGRYIGTFQMNDSALVFHAFEI